MKYFIYRFKWHLAEKFNIHFKAPLHLDIELSGKCNLACGFCRFGYDPEYNGSRGIMSDDRAIDIILQASQMNVPSLKFQARGESALNKNLEKYISFAKSMGIVETQLNTNLVAFSEKRLEALAESGLDRLIVSIDGATKETYEKIRVGAKWRKLIANLQHIYALPNRPKIRIQMVYQDDNKTEVDLFRKNFSQWCDELLIKPLRESNLGKERKSCGQPKQRMLIGWDGKVYGCCNCWHEESFIGDMGKKTLSVIWKDKLMTELRRKARRPQLGEPCKSCLVKSSYK